MWFSAVRSEMESSLATWRLVSPRATSRATSRSRATRWRSLVERCRRLLVGYGDERGRLVLFFGKGVLDGFFQSHSPPMRQRLLPRRLPQPRVGCGQAWFAPCSVFGRVLVASRFVQRFSCIE